MLTVISTVACVATVRKMGEGKRNRPQCIPAEAKEQTEPNPRAKEPGFRPPTAEQSQVPRHCVLTLAAGARYQELILGYGLAHAAHHLQALEAGQERKLSSRALDHEACNTAPSVHHTHFDCFKNIRMPFQSLSGHKQRDLNRCTAV